METSEAGTTAETHRADTQAHPLSGVPSKTTRAILFGVPIVTTVLSPSPIRPVNSTSVTMRGDGGTKKSSPLTTVPNGVLTAIRPDPVPGGASVSMVVVVAELRMARTRLNSPYCWHARGQSASR